MASSGWWQVLEVVLCMCNCQSNIWQGAWYGCRCTLITWDCASSMGCSLHVLLHRKRLFGDLESGFVATLAEVTLGRQNLEVVVQVLGDCECKHL